MLFRSNDTATTVGVVPLGSASLIGVMAVGGLFSGLIMPSRDMIVRAMTPPGSFGKVFGFVTTGFNLGGIISPLLFGWLMDQGHPRAIFLLGAAFSLLRRFQEAPHLGVDLLAALQEAVYDSQEKLEEMVQDRSGAYEPADIETKRAQLVRCRALLDTCASPTGGPVPAPGGPPCHPS